MTKKVDAIVVSINNPESYEGLKNYSGDELLTKIREGEIDIPKTENRENFIKFATADVDARDEFIKSIKSLQY